jgi:hypothetical protein
MQTMTNAPDGILDEYYRLSTMNTINDPQAHAEEWRQLAINAALEDRISTSINCMTRVQYWQGQVPCIRLVDGDFSELVPTEHKTDEVQGVYDWQSRADMD